MAEQIAQFRFLGYHIVESSIKIDSQANGVDDLKVNIKNTTGIDESNLKLKLELALDITNDSGSFNAFVKAVGYFEFDKDISDEHKRVFFNRSAPAILYPYLRAYVTSLTALSGIEPVILPTVNLSARN